MDSELIKFKEVKTKFGKNLVLDSISFDVPEGKVTGIIGASGEGKTTILKLLVGFYKPTSGEIIYSKRHINQDMNNIKKIFGFSTEEGSFHERLTVYENMKHFGSLHKIPKHVLPDRISELLNFVGLEEATNTFAGNLSMGMKKRLDVAISLVHEPKIIIMDEPTADLDPLLRDHMLDLIKKINDKGTTVILTTQMLGEMDKVCDKIIILYNKNIVEQGSPREIKNKYKESDLDGVFNKIFSQRDSKRREALGIKSKQKVKSEDNDKENIKPDKKEKSDKEESLDFEEIEKIKEEISKIEKKDEITEDKKEDENVKSN